MNTLLLSRFTYVWYSEEVELQHSDDGLRHGRPVGEVVAEPVAGVSTAARERGSADDQTALPSGTLHRPTS